MPLLGGDSNSFWRFDLKMMLQGLAVVVLLRGVAILFDVYPQHIPFIDDIINAALAAMQWMAVSFNRIASQYTPF